MDLSPLGRGQEALPMGTFRYFPMCLPLTSFIFYAFAIRNHNSGTVLSSVAHSGEPEGIPVL